MSVILNTCGAAELDFWQLLAGSLVKDSEGNIRIRTILHQEACTALDPLIDCTLISQDPKDLIKQAFSLDSCGQIALNLSVDTIV